MENENSLLVKSNTLETSRYRLNIVEQKILCKIITMINKGDTDFKDYSIKKTELVGLIGNNQNLYSNVKKYTENLLKRPITIKDYEKKETIQTNWFALIKHKNNGTISFSFHPYLKPYLLELKKCFTSFDYKNIQRLQSKYSPRIYELLKQYEKIKVRTMEIKELRDLFLLENKYKKYIDFKRNVLLISQKEINLHTDISFDFEEIKDSRKIVSIKFHIHKTKIDDRQINIDQVDGSDLESVYQNIRDIVGASISMQAIEKLIAEGEEETINYYLQN
jgi:plasmid replication initiation protein